MSLRALTAVWETSTFDGGTLLVLLALADYADEHGWSYPSIATLSRKARLSERATQYCLRDLAARGEVVVEERTGPKGCNRYRVTCLDGGANSAPRRNCTGAIDDTGGANGSAGGCSSAHEGVQPTAPKPPRNHQQEPPKEPPAAACNAPEHERPAAALSQPGLADAQSSAAGETNVVDAMLDAFLAAMQTDLAALREKVALDVVRHAGRAVELGHHADDVDPAVRAWRRNLESGARRHAVRPPRSGQVLDALVKWAATAPPVPLLHPTDIIAPAIDLGLLWKQPDPTPPTAAEQLWSRVLADLRIQMTTATYNAWLRDTRALSLDGDLVVEVPTPAHRDWLTNRLGVALRSTVERVAGAEVAGMRLVVAGAVEAALEAPVPA
ncbi:MAG: hypothetical protein IT341_06905 [Chloroflexi bacterium]|nr:hypothetical protein [Chloroflexota bacterium]